MERTCKAFGERDSCCATWFLVGDVAAVASFVDNYPLLQVRFEISFEKFVGPVDWLSRIHDTRQTVKTVS